MAVSAWAVSENAAARAIVSGVITCKDLFKKRMPGILHGTAASVNPANNGDVAGGPQLTLIRCSIGK
jgi:hypothetical protein